jgi:predicted peroxiredoxin
MLFSHISSGRNDPHRLLMALNMAAIMAEDKDVLVYFDINGVQVVLSVGLKIIRRYFILKFL